MLSVDQGGARGRDKAESALHSVFKLCLTVALSVACVRVSVGAAAPLRVDAGMALYGLVLLIASLPCAGVIAALSPPGDRKRRVSLVALAGVVAVLGVGYGQVLAAQLSVRDGWALDLADAGVAILGCGVVTVAGTIGHFYCVRRLMKADRTELPLVLIDAFIAAAPTFLAVYVASSYLGTA